MSGRKQVYSCPRCLKARALSFLPFTQLKSECPYCGGETESMLKPLMQKGHIVTEFPEPRKIRKYVLEQINKAIIK